MSIAKMLRHTYHQEIWGRLHMCTEWHGVAWRAVVCSCSTGRGVPRWCVQLQQGAPCSVARRGVAWRGVEWQDICGCGAGGAWPGRWFGLWPAYMAYIHSTVCADSPHAPELHISSPITCACDPLSSAATSETHPRSYPCARCPAAAIVHPCCSRTSQSCAAPP